jgi:CDP-diacylglycerol--serine O-phosphatidyltransferase
MSYRLTDETVRPEVRVDAPDTPPVVVNGGFGTRRAAMRTISVLPTMLTLGNLLCGFGSVFFASRPIDTAMPLGWTPLSVSAAFIFLGMVFDAMDGRVARLTRNTSDLGEQLDSMADMVTFGVAPAFLAVELIGVETPFISAANDQIFDRLVVVIACIYVACAALRLARFNIQQAQQKQRDMHLSFEGLPSPGAAGTVASLVLLHQHFLIRGDPMDLSIRLAAFGMVVIMLLAASGMVGRLRYVHVVSRYLSGRAGFTTIARVVAVGLLLLIHPQGALAAGFVLYALSAPAVWAWRKLWGVKTGDGETGQAASG